MSLPLSKVLSSCCRFVVHQGIERERESEPVSAGGKAKVNKWRFNRDCLCGYVSDKIDMETAKSGLDNKYLINYF